MKKFKSLLIAALFIVCGSSVFAADANATVTFVSGKVEVFRGEKWIPLQKGDTVAKSEMVSTGFQSEAKLKILDSVMYLGPVTRITLEELSSSGDKDNVNVYLKTGSARSQVKHVDNKRVDYKVHTAIAVASCRGTDWTMDDSNAVECYEGTVAVAPYIPPQPDNLITNGGESDEGSDNETTNEEGDKSEGDGSDKSSSDGDKSEGEKADSGDKKEADKSVADSSSDSEKSDSKTEVKADSKSDSKSDNKADSKTESKSDSKSDSKTDSKSSSSSKSDTKSDSKSNTKTETKSTTRPAPTTADGVLVKANQTVKVNRTNEVSAPVNTVVKTVTKIVESVSTAASKENVSSSSGTAAAATATSAAASADTSSSSNNNPVNPVLPKPVTPPEPETKTGTVVVNFELP